MERCSHTGKVRHEKRADALRSLARLQFTKRYDGHIYRCSACHDFHVGRETEDLIREGVIAMRTRVVVDVGKVVLTKDEALRLAEQIYDAAEQLG